MATEMEKEAMANDWVAETHPVLVLHEHRLFLVRQYETAGMVPAGYFARDLPGMPRQTIREDGGAAVSADYNEFDVRELRDLVFEVPATDNCWEQCRKNWMKPEAVAWLQREAQKLTGAMPVLVMGGGK